MTTNPFLVEPFRFPNVHGRVGGDGGGNGGGRGGGGEGPVPSPKRIRSPLPKPLPTPKSLGFVDIQVNGYLGISFSADNLTVERCAECCRAILLKGGCAAIVPTMITSAPSTYEKNLPIIAEVIEMPEFRNRLLGIHLEGPFISAEPGAVGAHPGEHAVSPAAGAVALLKRWQELARGHIVLLTLAAELGGAAKLCAAAVAMNIRVSLGHQMAIGADLGRLADAGATLVTHLGNGLPNMIHRHDNVLWPALADDRLSAMLITDGHHLPRALIVTALRAKGVGGIVVTSDVAPVGGLSAGVYECFGSQVRVDGTCVRHPTRDCLAGSGALMVDCMNHLASLGASPAAGAPPLTLEQLVAVSFDNPLRAIGIDPTEYRRRIEGKGVERVAWREGGFVLV